MERQTRSLEGLGQVVITSNASTVLSLESAFDGLARHSRGDWGDICAEDARVNESALKHGGRLMSVYTDANSVKFWIITDGYGTQEPVTTILLPEDY